MQCLLQSFTARGLTLKVGCWLRQAHENFRLTGCDERAYRQNVRKNFALIKSGQDGQLP